MEKKKNIPYLLEFPKIEDRRGNLSFIEGGGHVPFDIKRVFYIYDVPGGESRGGHAHKKLEQVMFAASGSFTMMLTDGNERMEFFLNRPWQGLYVPTGYWTELVDFSSGAVCMVLASDHYDPADYIYDYPEFLKYKGIASDDTVQ